MRHGQSVWNAERRLAGQADIPISELGHNQVVQQKETVQRLQPATIVCSDLRRARQSSSLLGFDSPAIDQRLREANVGAWEGEYIATLPKEHYQAWRIGEFTPPQGESWHLFCNRVEEVLNERIATGGICLLVTHGGVIRAACDRLLGLSPQQILPVSPASITVFDVYDTPKLSAFNLAHNISLGRFE